MELDPILARIGFVVIVVATGGLALLAYPIAWALMPAEGSSTRAAGRLLVPSPARRPVPLRGRLAVGVGLLALALLLSFRELGIWWSDEIAWPLVLASAGVALLWGGGSSTAGRPGGGTGSVATAREERSDSPLALYRGGFGVALVIGAGLLFLSAIDALGPTRDAVFTAVVSILALALILAPFLWRLGRNLVAERAQRIRSQEKAELAAHLHDSVLQTLTLMQKQAGDPAEVATLARRQERELRSWLAGDRGAEAGARRFSAALSAALEAVEDAHRVKVELVSVGDRELDQGAEALIAAAREAATNAAKFGAEPISVFAEVTGEGVEVYVRDRGPGFDPEAIPPDRSGVRESIRGRMHRAGGTATIDSSPGAGTEVRLLLPRPAQ